MHQVVAAAQGDTTASRRQRGGCRMPSAYVRLTFCKDCSPPPRALEPGARLEHRTRTYVLPGSGDPRPNYIYTQLLPAVVLAWKCDVRACRRECVAYAAWRSVVTIHWSRPVSANWPWLVWYARNREGCCVALSHHRPEGTTYTRGGHGVDEWNSLRRWCRRW